VFTGKTAEKFEEGFDPIRGVIDVDRMREARALLSLFMLRRRKDQIKMTLPPKTEVVVTCGLTDTQRAWYKRILTGVRSDLIAGGKSGDIADADWRKLLNILLQLRKVREPPCGGGYSCCRRLPMLCVLLLFA
jgi:SNF2 family DNA or RNA helicase